MPLALYDLPAPAKLNLFLHVIPGGVFQIEIREVLGDEVGVANVGVVIAVQYQHGM
jgi:hypothetical protein